MLITTARLLMGPLAGVAKALDGRWPWRAECTLWAVLQSTVSTSTAGHLSLLSGILCRAGGRGGLLVLASRTEGYCLGYSDLFLDSELAALAGNVSGTGPNRPLIACTQGSLMHWWGLHLEFVLGFRQRAGGGGLAISQSACWMARPSEPRHTASGGCLQIFSWPGHLENTSPSA